MAFPYLVHHEHSALVELCDFLAGKIQDASRSGDHDVHHGVESHDVVPKACTASRDHDFDAQVLAQLLAHLAGLERQLASWNEHHSCSNEGTLTRVLNEEYACKLWMMGSQTSATSSKDRLAK